MNTTKDHRNIKLHMGFLQILETDDLGKASKNFITGGASSKISLYYDTELKLTKC